LEPPNATTSSTTAAVVVVAIVVVVCGAVVGDDESPLLQAPTMSASEQKAVDRRRVIGSFLVVGVKVRAV
jgi:Na+/H+ antiporter NhaC